MPTHIFHLPPEILLQILENLSVTPLLRFAQTSKSARDLAYPNVKSLSLAIYPSHQSSRHRKLFADRHKPMYPLHAAIQIPRARDFDYPILAIFHDKVLASILNRHAYALRHLDIALWRLSMPIAKAITQMPALRGLSIRIESTQASPRKYMGTQRREEMEAWSLLASNTTYMIGMQTLSIQNAELSATQLVHMVGAAECLRDLRLSTCGMLTSTLWSSGDLSGLNHLSVTDCANVLVNEAAVETISKMNKLQVLDLHGCGGLDGEVLEQWNRDHWRVPKFVAPTPRGASKEDSFIEVDPEYMFDVGEG